MVTADTNFKSNILKWFFDNSQEFESYIMDKHKIVFIIFFRYTTYSIVNYEK